MSPTRPAMLRRAPVRACLWTAAALAILPMAGAAHAQGPAPHDTLDAVLWVQRSVEFKASALGAFALARKRLDEALADRNWTAVPAEQSGTFQDFPPALILDLDETVLDNSLFHAWMVKSDKPFDPKAWTRFVASETSTVVDGALDFAKYADSKGVKVFYVSNRTSEEKESTRRNMARLGFPMGGNVDVFLMTRDRPDWTSAKGTRRAFIAKDYRVLLNLGDNLGDFTDAFRGSEVERLKVYDDNRARWGREWIMLPNPKYGSFESAPYGHNFKLSREGQRKAKLDAIEAWSAP